MKNLLLFPILLFAYQIAFCQWTVTDLSTYKEAMGAVVQPGTSNFWFAGGSTVDNETDKVEIYNAETSAWTYSNLSMARSFVTGAAYGELVFFAGGMNWLSGEPTSRVDIWDASAETWSTAELSVPRMTLSVAAAAGKVMFAGGASLQSNLSYDVVDIYDMATKQWSTTTMPSHVSPSAVAVVETEDGPIAVFAGGGDINADTVSSSVSIYHFSTNTWTASNLSEARSFIAATVVGNKVLFAGGMKNDNTPSDRVDIYDAATGEWSIAQLASPRGMFNYGATACGKAYFVGGGDIDIINNQVYSSSNVIDIYDPATDTWDALIFDRELFFHSVLSDGDHLLIAGGRDFAESKLYKKVDIYTCPADAVEDEYITNFYLIYPNPNTGSFYLEKLGVSPQKPALARVYNALGQMVLQIKLSPSDEKMELNLAPGSYFITIISDGKNQTEKVIVQ